LWVSLTWTATAHWIRNSKSRQFRACESLSSQRRWCLTGTPIQNRLEDLGSLISFLHIHPFSEPSVFRKTILEPLMSDARHRTRNLQLPLQSICLRRDSKVLRVPEPEDTTSEIQMSEQERGGYDSILQESRREIERIVSRGDSTVKKYNALFTTMLKLRRYCNNGTFKTDLDTGNECGTCNALGGDNLAILDGFDDCPECGRLLRSQPASSSVSLEDVAANPLSSGSSMVATSYDLATGGYSSKVLRLVQNIQAMKTGDKR
jgi:SWI/SNF-related matrix-associated actin-dependent regulator of chromatin subfamily A3